MTSAGARGAVLLALITVAAVGCSEQPTANQTIDTGSWNPGAPLDSGSTAPPSDALTTPDQPVPSADLAPPPPPPPSLRVAVLSDLNGSYGSVSYGGAVHGAVSAITGRIKPDLVLIAGDMVAGQQSGLDYAAMWAGFHAAVTDPLTKAGIPIAVTPGNHDASGYAAYAGERAIYVDQWKARPPQVDQMVDAADYPLGYSFVHRGVFFLSIDATVIGPLKAAQRTKIDQQLAAAAAYPLRFAFGHLPIHSVTVGRETEILGDTALEQLLAQHQLALYLSGHHHGYYPGAAGGLRQISVGCLGSGARKLIGTSAASPLSLVVIEIDAGAVTLVEAFSGGDFDQPVTRSGLPEKLTYGSHELTRDDLAGF